MYNTNWEEKYNRKAFHEMTAEEAFDLMEWDPEAVMTEDELRERLGNE